MRVFIVAIAIILTACSNEETNLSANQIKPEGVVAEKRYSVKENFNVGVNVFVRALDYDSQSKNIWVGTSVGALQVNSETGEVIKTFTRENGLANEYVFSAFVNQQGEVWLGTNGGGVSQFRSNTWKTYFPMHGLADYWVYSFTEQPGEALWVGTWAGLSRLDYKTGEFKTYLKELVNEWVYGLDVDSQSRLWVGTEGGVNMFDGEKWFTWTHDDGLGAENKRKLSFSVNTGLGTRNRHDLSVLANGEESYNTNYVFCVKVAEDDSVWVGTWGGGVSYFKNKKWNNLTTKEGLAGNIVYSMAIGNDGVFWFGTNKGVSRFDGKDWQTIAQQDGLLDQHVYAIEVSGNNQVWAGTRHGVTLIAN